MENAKNGNIFLIGFMGAGKSTIARLLQKQTGMKLVEMDERIVQEQGMPITEIFERYGEDRFRELESELVKTLGQEGNTVVSCGGGAVIRQENRDAMKQGGTVVYLTAKPETILERVRGSKDRPILNGNMNVEYIAQLMEKRRAVYEAAADISVATDKRSKNEICEEIIGRLKLNEIL